MLKKYPFTKQEGLKDCAAASVSMIIKYYKGYVSLKKLSEMLKITKNGTTAYHIVTTLKQLGFNAKGLKVKTLENTKQPFIANVILKNSYKHFLVVYEVKDKYILVADPADKIKKMKKEDFYKIWTNIKIEAYPESIIPKEREFSLKQILKVISPNTKIIIKLGILSILITITSIISSFFFQSLIISLNKENNYLIITCIIFSIIILINIIVNYIRNKLSIKFTHNLDKKLTEETFNNIIKLPYLYYHNHTTGEIISKINDLKIVKEIISKTLITLFLDLPLTIFTSIVLIKLNSRLFIIVLLILMLYFITLKIFKKNLNLKIENALKNKADTTSFMTEAISGFETIKALSIEPKINKIFKEKNNIYLENSLKLQNLINLQYLIKDLINAIGTALIIIIGILDVKRQIITLPVLITYNALVTLFLGPVRNMIDLDFEIKEAISSLRRVFELYEKEKPINNIKNGQIKIENLNYTFDDQNYILKNINLTIDKASKILISGKSGSGKSTLSKILKGYYKDYEGKITINGKDIKQNTPKINYISLKETLFTGTVDYNLKLKGSKKLNKRKELCYTNEIVSDNPLKYNLVLEENGFNISDGQKQRLALARALTNFDILIIDEALSALNTDLERKILKKLLKTYRHKTIIFISHRLDNLDLFDRYIKLDKGEISLNETRA